jgi:glucoamylase
MSEDFFHDKKPYFLNSAKKLEEFFKNEYAINRDNPNIATAIGRYPEDVYTGTTTDGPANAWFITTHAMAEFYCKLSKFEKNSNKSKELKDKGIKFFERTLLHRDPHTNEMSEQYSRNDGALTGAKSLTWSYASYLTAYLACR